MSASSTKGIWKVIIASSLGTLIEAYDFLIFGSLAIVISTKFFPEENPNAAFLSTLATFAVGFIVRPFGALFFGRLGDLIGRKYTFQITLLLMGGSTFLLGCIPGYESIGFMAPLLVVVLRILQGLAFGGEYGGAATYVAEHSPMEQRGYWTSWIQAMGTFGLCISLMVIFLTRNVLTPNQFEDWGWRVPFWLSILMVVVSYIIRKKMNESPVYAKAKAEGKISANPLKESLGNKYNLKFILLALFGAVMGQGVIWHTGQIYAMSFIKTVMLVNSSQADSILVIALLFGTPFILFFGWLSDKVGRKVVMMLGMLSAILLYRPIYRLMYETTDVSLKTEITDKAKLTAITKENSQQQLDSIYASTKEYEDGTKWTKIKTVPLFKGQPVLADKGVAKLDPKVTVIINDKDKWILIFLVFIQVIFVAMVYGPIAAFLVEMFPVKIRYTSMSVPYHIGNGFFGGLLPAISTYFETNAKDGGNPEFYLEGLWYPILIAGVSFIIGMVYLKRKNNIENE